MRDYSLVPDAHNLMESTRSIGYSLSAAVADIVDNSIAACASEVQITGPTPSRQFLSVLDDGIGMTEDELLVAMKYGSRPVDEERRKVDLGRFGLGLKMASLSQCRRLKVVSKRNGKICGACWDLDYVASSKEVWPLRLMDSEDLRLVPNIDILERKSSGTLVVWENVRRCAKVGHGRRLIPYHPYEGEIWQKDENAKIVVPRGNRNNPCIQKQLFTKFKG